MKKIFKKRIIILLLIIFLLAISVLFNLCGKREWVYNVGDEVVLGQYFSDENDIFRSKGLEWIVIRATEDTVTLITKDIIDWEYYSQNEYQIQSRHIWKESDLRNWLNYDFYTNSIEFDRSLEVIGIKQSFYTQNNSEKNFYDNICLLKTSDIKDGEEWLKAKPTPYAIGKGAITSEDGFSSWWLMPESNDTMVGYVDIDGEIKYEKLKNKNGIFQYGDVKHGVRPIIIVSQEYWQKVPLGKVKVRAD